MLHATPDDIELTVPGGSCVAVAGPSGAGKTTLLRQIAGLTRPARGRIDCDGETWFDGERGIDRPAERRRVGFVFQDYALFPHLSAADNVRFGAPHADAQTLLGRLGIDTTTAARKPPTLSGGERQRVALARALARDPQVLLLDEPLSALDPRTRGHAARELRGVLAEVEAPAVLVTHLFAEAATLADEVAVLDGGRIVQRGTAAELSARPASAFVADFTGAVVLTGDAVSGRAGLTEVALDGGGHAASTDSVRGRVALSVHPSEIALEPVDTEPTGSPLNHLRAQVVSITPLGNRVRVALSATQPLAAEITRESLERLRLAPGTEVLASWKATATRLAPLA